MFLPEHKTPWWHYIIAPAVFILYFYLTSLIPPSAEKYFFPGFIVYLCTPIVLALVAVLRRFIDERRALIDFRSLSREEQQQFLQTVWPSVLRSEYLRLVDMEETYTTDGQTVSFPFPQAERRLHRRLTLLSGTLVVGLLILSTAFRDFPLWIRAVPLVVAAIALWPTAWLVGRLSLLETTFRVTPFHVEMVGPGRPSRRIRYGQPLVILNPAARGFFEIHAIEQGTVLRLHHARLGALYAYNLIKDYAGLEPLPEEPPAAT
jgi:hypothetical protein